MIAKACTLTPPLLDGLQGRSAVAYRESAWLRGLPTLKLPNQRCREQRFEIADFLFGRALRVRSEPSGHGPGRMGDGRGNAGRGLGWPPRPQEMGRGLHPGC